MNGTIPEPVPETRAANRYLGYGISMGAMAGIITAQGNVPFYVILPVASLLAGWIAGMENDKKDDSGTPMTTA